MSEPPARSRTVPGDLVAGGLFAVLGVAVGVRAVALHVGSALDPQPGFFPFIGSGLLVLLGGCLALRSLWPAGPRRDLTIDSLGPPAVLVTGLAFYAALLEWVGYPVMTTLVTLLVLRVQQTGWLRAILVSVLLSAGSYLLFVQLGVPLPAGRLLGR